MMLTSEQKAAVHCDENVMLTACPGSGKTRVIVSKLIRVVHAVRDTPRAVACITYTNAAVYEMESRLRLHIQPGDDRYFDIGTIHSFCLNHIFRPFCHLIEGYTRGFKVFTPDNDEFEKCVTSVCGKFGRSDLSFKDFDDFTQLRVSSEGRPVGNAIDRGSVTPEMAGAYWKRCGELGFIDFANIIYYSLRLLRERPEVLDSVASSPDYASAVEILRRL